MTAAHGDMFIVSHREISQINYMLISRKDLPLRVLSDGEQVNSVTRPLYK